MLKQPAPVRVISTQEFTIGSSQVSKDLFFKTVIFLTFYVIMYVCCAVIVQAYLSVLCSGAMIHIVYVSAVADPAAG